MTSIAITGASGFIGRHLRSYFELAGYDVRCIGSVTNTLESVGGRFALDETLDGVDVLIHAAWSGSRRPLRERPDVQMANVEFARVLARSVSSQRVQTVVGLGSQAEFASSENPWLDDSPVAATDPYSQAKIQVRQVLEASKAEMVWMRLFSVYGPGDESDWIFPRVVRGTLNDESVTLGPCENLWNLLYVSDVVSAISYGVEKKVQGSVVVTGTHSRPLKDWLTEAVSTLSGAADTLIFTPFGESGRGIDAKPQKLLSAGWHPNVDFRIGTKQFANWILAASEKS